MSFKRNNNKLSADESDNWRKRTPDPSPNDSNMSKDQPYPNYQQYGCYDYGTNTYHDTTSQYNRRHQSNQYSRYNQNNNYGNRNNYANYNRESSTTKPYSNDKIDPAIKISLPKPNGQTKTVQEPRNVAQVNTTDNTPNEEKPKNVEVMNTVNQDKLPAENKANNVNQDRLLAENRADKNRWFNIVEPTTTKNKADTVKNWRTNAAPLPEKPYCHPFDRSDKSNRKNIFKPFLSITQMEEGIKNGTLFQGIMRLTKSRDDAYVTVDDLDSDIYIGGTVSRNRSLHGDLVAVRLLGVDPVWDLKKERDSKRRKEKLQRNGIEEDKEEEEGDHVGEDEENSEEEEKVEYKPAYCGEVVGILLHPPDISYSGFIIVDRFSDMKTKKEPQSEAMDRPARLNFAWFKPNDKKVPFIIIRNEDIPKDLLENQEYYRTHLFSADIRRWRIMDTFPTGRILKELGPIGDLFAERESIISENNVIAHNFSEVALRGLPELPWYIPSREFEIRRDLRANRVFSIDPSTAKDLDDALHINQLADGYYEVGVHIADVSYFLKKGSPLDTEARLRGTSTYLVESVIPMLPNVLCEELCSLNPGVDRLAFSVIWKMDPNGVPVDTWYGKTIIRSCGKLAYEDAQCVLDGGALPNTVQLYDGHSAGKVAYDIILLDSIAKKRREKRYANGSLSLNSVKLNFKLNENGEPISVHKFEPKEANKLIEEFMLCANISVAQKIASVFPDESLLRRHEEPLERRLDDFLKLTDSLGLEFDGQSAGSLQSSFDKIQNPDVKDVLLILAIRCMQRAKYFCSGVADISKYGHYALNEPLYTHFTSPIRRYADVIVHRLLEAAITGKDNCGYEKKVIQKICFTCNAKKEGAKSAQESSINLYLSRYLSEMELNEGPIYTKADVTSIGKEIYEVYVPALGLEKKIFIQSLPTEQHHYDRKTQTLDIFWKHGVPVSMINEEKIYAQERVRKEDYSDEEEEEEQDDLVDKFDTLSLNESSNNKELLEPSVILEPVTGLQRIRMFSNINVRIQVNMDISPPIINIYPVNPFSGETVIEQYF